MGVDEFGIVSLVIVIPDLIYVYRNVDFFHGLPFK